MKIKFLALAASVMFLFACSDDASTQANGTSTQGNESSAQTPEMGHGSSVHSSCRVDESFFEHIESKKRSVLKKEPFDDIDVSTDYEDPGDAAALEWQPDRNFTLEENGDSVLVSIDGVVAACNKVVRRIDFRQGGDTLYVTPVYAPDVETTCLCTGAGLSFMVAQEYAGIRTVVIGDEVFPFREPIRLGGCESVELPEGCECHIDMIICPNLVESMPDASDD